MAERKILLDAPSTGPALDFERIARALADVITDSKPRFAIGIFGGWGSGKTTLMEAIQSQLESSPFVVSAEFNAWRFEREPSMLVPLLDIVRGALAKWSTKHDANTRQRAQRATKRIAAVVRGLATGLSGEVGVPGAAKISYDVSKALSAMSVSRKPDQPQSLYVAAYEELAQAMEEFTSGGATRVVIFVDDLDRCLPSNALAVLESMKLFFDLPGFIFVVGLDDNVVQRAVRARFSEFGVAASTSTTGNEGVAGTSGQEIEQRYIEKIFQVPYRLPPAATEQLRELLESMCSAEGLPETQRDDFNKRVVKYLHYVAVKGQINPREVKRFLNTYTLQRLIRDDLKPDIVLALQVLVFRYDGRPLYDAILADSKRFLDALNRYRQQKDDSAFEDVSPGLNLSSAGLGDYLQSDLVAPLAAANSLAPYLSRLRATGAVAQFPSNAYRTNYAANVISVLQAALPHGWYLIREPQIPDYQFDAMITGTNAKQIVVEVFVNQSFTGGQFSRAIKNGRQSQQLRIDAVLAVAASRNAPGFRRLKVDLSTLALPNQVVEWDPGTPAMTLIDALNELINELQA